MGGGSPFSCIYKNKNYHLRLGLSPQRGTPPPQSTLTVFLVQFPTPYLAWVALGF